jgi:putative PIN family toxin of toxin-antitoxin system
MTRVVLDTNTILSAIIWSGVPRQVYEAGFTEQYQLVTSVMLFAELDGVLHRAKFAPMLKAANLVPDQIIESVRSAAEFVAPAEIPAGVVRDPKDVVVLACAVGGQADYIVSGDQDLLTLGQ